MSTSRFLKTSEALSVLLGAALLLASFAVTPSLAKKPPKEPPQPVPPPVQYHVTWLDGLAGAGAYATDVNVDCIIVGDSDGRAAYWLPPLVAPFDLNDESGIPGDFHLYKAERINNDGLIAGAYECVNGSKGVYVYDLVDGTFFCSAPADIGSGSVFAKGINRDGTVVGEFRLEGSPWSIFVGFAWNCHLHDGKDVYLLPEPYLATDINDNGEVVGKFDAKSGDYGVFKWTLTWDWDEQSSMYGEPTNSPADTAAVTGGGTKDFPGPVINNPGAIAALIDWGRNIGRVISLREPGDTEWHILFDSFANRLAINDQKQVLWSAMSEPSAGSDFNRGFVIVGDKAWSLENEQLIVDSDGEWFTGSHVPEAVADASGLTVSGFSPVVGWHYNGRAFLLIPVAYPTE